MINESCSLGNRVEGCNIPQTLKMKFKVATILGSASSVSGFYFSELFSDRVKSVPFPLLFIRHSVCGSFSILWSQYACLLEEWPPWKWDQIEDGTEWNSVISSHLLSFWVFATPPRKAPAVSWPAYSPVIFLFPFFRKCGVVYQALDGDHFNGKDAGMSTLPILLADLSGGVSCTTCCLECGLFNGEVASFLIDQLGPRIILSFPCSFCLLVVLFLHVQETVTWALII